MAQPRLQLFPLPPDDTVCPGTLLEVEQDCRNFIYEAQHALGELRAEFPGLADFAFPQDAEFKGMGRIGRTVWEAIAHVIIRRGGLMVPEYAIQPANLANPICLQCLKPFPRPQSGQIASVVPHPCRPVHYLAQILYRVARRGRVVDVGRHRDLVWLLMNGDQEGNLALPQVQAREEMVVAQWQEAVDGIQLELEEAERKVSSVFGPWGHVSSADNTIRSKKRKPSRAPRIGYVWLVPSRTDLPLKGANRRWRH